MILGVPSRAVIPMPVEWVDTAPAAAEEPDEEGPVSLEGSMAGLLVGEEAAAAAAASLAARGVVDVGSSLAEADWNDIDDKDVSSRKGGGGHHQDRSTTRTEGGEVVNKGGGGHRQ